MLNNEIVNLINEYCDGELNPEQESYLFSILSANTEAREYFKRMNELKTYTASSKEDFPESLDNRILASIKKPSIAPVKVFKPVDVFSYLAYALVLLVVISGYIFFGKYSIQQEQLTTANETISRQRDLIQLITLNESEEVKVHGELENKIIIKANM